MTQERSIHLMVGGLLLWSMVPFPFLYIVLPPFWIAVAAVGVWRIARPEVVWQPSRVTLNVLAVAVIVAVVVAGGFRVGPLRPLGHLLLLLTAVRVAAVNDLKGLRRTLPIIFLGGLVAIVSAVHVSILPYLLGSLVLWWYAGMRVFLFQLSFECGEDLGRPSWKHAATAAMVAAMLTVPFFMVLPRLTSPLVGTVLVRESGFSEAVELSRRGEISESEAPAATLVSVDGEAVPASWTRLRASAYDRLHGATWAPRKTGLVQPNLRNGLVWLDADRRSTDGLRAVDITLEDRNRFLFMPAGAIAVEVDEAVLIDPPGGVVLRARHGPVPSYRVWIAETAMLRRDKPGDRDLRLKDPDLRTARLASRICMETESAGETASAIESYLSAEYTYSLAGGVGGSVDPVSWFLFESRQGHCEFFAAAMVVMLRHQGVPARLVVGFHGGDADVGGDRVVIRRSNAHTWVEAWLGEDRGWVVFDPTPAEGVDGLKRLDWLERGRLMWQSFEDFFDRRILTFGLGEQTGLLMAVGGAIKAVSDWVRLTFRWWWLVLVAGLISLPSIIPAVWKMQNRPRRRVAARAVARMAGKLKRAGVDVPEWATVGWVGQQSAKMWPVVAGDVARVVALAEDELYGGVRAGDDHSKAIRSTWRRIRKQMR